MRVGFASWCLAVLILAAGQAEAQCRVEGLVRTEDGTPLVGATVRIEVPDQRAPLTATVGPDGRYVIQNVKAGIWAHIVVQQEGRLLAQAFTLVTQRVEPVDLVAQPSNSKVTGNWDLDPGGGPSGAISGFVRRADGVLLPAARVTVVETTVTATTDSAGRYVLGGLRSGVVVDLEASAPGFKPATAQAIVPEGGRLDANFTLDAAAAGDQPGAGLGALYVSDDDSRVTAHREQVAAVPSPGRGDVFRSLQFLPGVSGATEASGELYVRGGTPGDNLVTLDGFTLYPVARVFGPFSLLNPDAVEAVNFSRSPVDAADGGRLAGVARLTGRSSTGDRPSASADFSMLGPRAVVSVPFGKRGSFLVAARKSFSASINDRILDVLADTGGDSARTRTGRFSGGSFGLTPTSSLQDLNAKLQVNVSSKDLVSASLYHAAEDSNNSRDLALTRDTSVSVPDVVELPLDTLAQLSDLQEWTARGMSASWNRQWSASASTTFSVGRSRTWTSGARAAMLVSASTGEDYSFVGGRAGSGALTDTNTIEDTTVRLLTSVTPGFGHAISLGGEITSIDATFGIQTEVMGFAAAAAPASSSLVGLASRQASGRLMTAFLQDSWRPFTRLTVSPGLRVTHYDVTAKNYADPRMSLTYQLSRLRLKAAWSIDHQQVNRVTYEDRVRGDRQFWALADGSTLLVPEAQQVSAGGGVTMAGLVVDVQGYYKRLDDLTMLAPRLFPGMPADATTQSWHHGTGTSIGLEMLLQKEWSRNTLWTAYTAQKTRYEYPTLQASKFPGAQDRLHEFKVANSLRLAGRWWCSAAWVMASGAPYTPASGVGQVWFPTGLTLTQVVFGDKNSERLPAYHRLDVATEREFRLGGFKSTLGATVFNVYNRVNVRERGYEVAGNTMNDSTAMGRVVNVFLRLGF